jgi:predicted nucleotidyltransferase
MVKSTINKSIVEKINKYKTLIEQSGVLVDKMILFGSYARDKATPHSDIDVCVVSKSFGKDDVEEMQMLAKKTRFVDTKIEPYPLSPVDLENDNSPIVFEINKYGILV